MFAKKLSFTVKKILLHGGLLKSEIRWMFTLRRVWQKKKPLQIPSSPNSHNAEGKLTTAASRVGVRLDFFFSFYFCKRLLSCWNHGILLRKATKISHSYSIITMMKVYSPLKANTQLTHEV